MGPWPQSAWVWLSPSSARHARRALAMAAGEKHQLDQEPSRGCKEQEEGWGQEKKPWHWGHIWAAAPSQGTLPARRPVHPAAAGDRGDQRSHRGHFALTFAPRSSSSGNLSAAFPTVCRHPATAGGWDSGAGTRPRQRHSPLPCSGTTQHVMALRPGRYRGGRQQQMGGTGTARHARQHPPNPAPRLINAYRAFAPITPSPVSCQCETPA